MKSGSWVRGACIVVAIASTTFGAGYAEELPSQQRPLRGSLLATLSLSAVTTSTKNYTPAPDPKFAQLCRCPPDRYCYTCPNTNQWYCCPNGQLCRC
jgi:hypothetical protein